MRATNKISKIFSLLIIAMIIFLVVCCGTTTKNGNQIDIDDENVEETGVFVGKVLPDWTEGYLDIHAINTGRGECTYYIFPDGTTMLVDGASSLISENDLIPPPPKKPNMNSVPGETIVNYIKHFSPTSHSVLDYILITHWDMDHLGGFSNELPLSKNRLFRLSGITEIGENIKVNKIIDRGYPNYNYPRDMKNEDKIDNYLKFVDWAKSEYNTSVEQFKVGETNQISLKENALKYSSFQIRNIIGNGIIWTGKGTDVKNLLPKDSMEIANAEPKENIFSLGFHLKYGLFDYFAGGDLQYNGRSTHAWKDVEYPVTEVMAKIEVLKANHHGTANCNSTEFLNKLQPDAVLIHTWRDIQPNPETIERIFQANNKAQVFTTNMTENNKVRLGNYVGLLKSLDGHIVVRVHPGGDEYSIFILDDNNEEYQVKNYFGTYKCN